MNSEIALTINNQNYFDWQQVVVVADIENVARSFSFGVSRPFSEGNLAEKIQQFDHASVSIDGIKVVNGHVDSTPVRYSKDTLDFSVEGRSNTADLIDCCSVKNGSFTNTKKVQIVKNLASQYNVGVIDEVGLDSVLAQYDIAQSERIFDAVDKLLRPDNVWITDDGLGRLLLVNAGVQKAEQDLVLGENILEINSPLDGSERFSEYVVDGQSVGNSKQFARKALLNQGRVIDSRLGRRRVMNLHQSGDADIAMCRDRAQFEHNYRLAKSLATTYVVDGWYQSETQLWQPNQLVKVFDPVVGFGLDDELLITRVAYVKDKERGTVSEITVAPAFGYRIREQFESSEYS